MENLTTINWYFFIAIFQLGMNKVNKILVKYKGKRNNTCDFSTLNLATFDHKTKSACVLHHHAPQQVDPPFIFILF